MEHGFCVILTKYRLFQGIALYHSLKNNMKDLKMFILCMDDETYEVLLKLNLENMMLIHVKEIENELLLIKKRERPLNAYCWTLKPIFLEHIINQVKDINQVTYLDADTYFFSDPSAILEEVANCSVLLSKHNFTRNLKSVESLCGKYNSGFVSFKRDENEFSALKWWKEKCLEWCDDKADKGKFGDQKYLDEIPLIFSGVCEIKTTGVNIGFWNHGRYKANIYNGKVHINNVALILYHFAGFRLLNEREFLFKVGFKKEFTSYIYDPYIKVLQGVIAHIKAVEPHCDEYFMNGEEIVQGSTIYTLER
ncbi:putative nucleotide-diphospho-sugar transferase [Marinisporobacter balticus]|uniref:Nucleotide-diphospho-sugar transferase n=1 Tax=Marinisporobacter balticus TaxID=2018667 RepID=A0A4R2KYT9_9FIRM|nr:putative nucleotide-diphospho-sugar transferase [Marinisporobacter balticus]TCO79063.1 nucleotide-diphospho-sugar transferase [Marinisporobacter balticus]